MDKALLRSLRDLDEYDLRRLIIYVQGLLADTDGPQFETPPDPDELTENAGRPKVTYRQQSVRCGKDGCTTCPHGPYWYAYWREDGRLRSRYVGKDAPQGMQ